VLVFTATKYLFQLFTDWMPFLPPNQQHQSTEGSITGFYNGSLQDLRLLNQNQTT